MAPAGDPLVLQGAPGDSEAGPVLAAFGRALGQEAHVLVSRSDLTWQQLHNRLQWVEGPVAARVAAERVRRSGPGGALWAATRTRFRESEELIRTLKGHTDWVNGCAVSPDGTWIVSASRDGTLRVWEAASGRHLHTLGGHTGAVWGCAVSPDGTWIVSASEDRTLRVWEAASGRSLRILEGHTDVVWGCAVSPDGTWIVSASRDGTLRVWGADEGRHLRTLRGHTDVVLGSDVLTGGVMGCAVSPDGTWIVSAGEDGTLRVWDPATGECLGTFAGHADRVEGCAVSPDGRWVLSASCDGTLKLWEAVNGEEALSLSLGDPVECVALHPWEPLAVCGDIEGGVHLFDLVGLEYGAIIVTAIHRAQGLVVRCPACQQGHPVTEDQLGAVRACPTPECGLSLRVNRFVVQGSAGAADDWSTV